MNERIPLTVKQLNVYIKSLFESDYRLADVLVCGEISNFKNHYQSGHLYFTLKDNDSAIRCVMFRNNAVRVMFSPCDGLKVIIRGRVSVYEKDGQYMLYAAEMHDAGAGDLALRFEQTKALLQKEGLFDEENKRPLPEFPKRIAVVTSDTGAAVKDITNILGLRYPLCEVVICPVLVQGENSAQNIIDTLDRVYALTDIDLIIVGRGGGSKEDLAAFNDEMLARKVFESPVPVISAVGHETDFTICDFVADKRASTPSHAAETAVPDAAELMSKIVFLENKNRTSLKAKYDICNEKLARYCDKFSFNKFGAFLDVKSQTVDELYGKLVLSFNGVYTLKKNEFIKLTSALDALSPLKTLSRGFGYVTKGGKAVKNVSELKPGDSISVTLNGGNAECLVNKIGKEVINRGKQ